LRNKAGNNFFSPPTRRFIVRSILTCRDSQNFVERKMNMKILESLTGTVLLGIVLTILMVVVLNNL